MIALDEAEARAEAGGKARTLAGLRRAGVPTLDGFVVLPDEEAPLEGHAPELAERLARLGGDRFVVRSSADLEDCAGLSAAGVYESVVDVLTGEVARAIEQVRASAHAEPARAYLAARGLTRRVRMAVLVQPMAHAAVLGVVHSLPVDEGAFVAEERRPTEPEFGVVSERRVPVESALGRLVAQVVALLGVPADVEYALAPDGAPMVLQARPLSTVAPVRDAALWRLPAELGAGRTWHRDAEHNPDPLSAAQASLVDLLNRSPGLPRQLVRRGYLYFERTAARGDSAVRAPIPLDELPRRYADEIEPACAALLAPLEALAPEATLLDQALAVFVEVARRYFGEVSPSLRAARVALDRLLQCSIGEPLEQHGGLLAGTGGRTRARDAALGELGRATDETREALHRDYLARYGAYAPAWDVAVPPDDEAPERVWSAAALVARGPSPEARHAEALAFAEAATRRVADRMERADRAAFLALLPSVRAALTLVEDDDALFFRAQRIVRRPLLAIGSALAARGELDRPEQVFALDVDDARRSVTSPDPTRLVRARASESERLGWRRESPPAAFRDGEPVWRGAGDANVLVGAGTSGRGYGRAFVLDDPALAPSALPSGAVLVVQAILPSLTYLLPGAAALVTDHGGALSHAATLAREYGVPAVLGTGRATRALVDGEAVIVDGDAGRVYRLDEGRTAGSSR